MRSVAMLDSYSGVAVLAALRRFEVPVIGAVVTDPTALRALRRLPDTAGIELIDGTSEGLAQAATRVAGLRPALALSLFWSGDPVTLTGGVPAVRILRIDDLRPDRSYTVDALPWALACGVRELTVRLRRTRAGDGHSGSWRRVIPIGDDHDLAALAEHVARQLLVHIETPAEPARPGPAWPPDDAGPPPAGRRVALSPRIEWARTSVDIANLVRALAPPASGAWTTWEGNRIVVGRARPADLAGGAALAGTILATGDGGTFVRTGDGVLLLNGLRDAIGPVDDGRLRVGGRLGIDLVEEIGILQQRVTDLEHVVRCLARRHELL